MTDKLDWYKRNPAKFFGGTVGMRWEIKCVYSVILDLIYDGNGSCPDDGPWIANLLGVGMSTRHWNSIRSELVAKGKLVLKDGRISNPAATRELARERLPTASPPRGGRKYQPVFRAEKTAEKPPDLFAANDLTPVSAPVSDPGPARARESQSQSQTRRLDAATIISTAEEIAAILTQPRGRYWETDLRKMLEIEELDPADVVAAARAHRGGPIRSVNALRGLAKRKRDERIEADPDASVAASEQSHTPEAWLEALMRLAARGVWSDRAFGPLPGTDGYRGPNDLEAQFLDVWHRQGRGPVEELDNDANWQKYPADNPNPERRERWSAIR